MRIQFKIDQHGTDNPTITVYKPEGLVLTGTRTSAGVNNLYSPLPIFVDGTGVFTSRQDHLADLSSGDLYGSPEDENNIKLVNWSHPDGIPVDEINGVVCIIEIP